MNRSDCTPRLGTQHLTVSAARRSPFRPGPSPRTTSRLCPLTFRMEAADRTRAAIHTGHRLASKRVSARLIPGHVLHPGSDANYRFRCFISGELSSPFRSPTDAIKDAFSSTLTTTVINQRGLRCFEASPRRAAPEGQQSSISHTVTRSTPCPHLPEDNAPCTRDTQNAAAFERNSFSNFSSRFSRSNSRSRARSETVNGSSSAG
jgi:hypothetical protein